MTAALGIGAILLPWHDLAQSAYQGGGSLLKFGGDALLMLFTGQALPSFPNHSTADQLYTDQKFEAYRALGHYLGERAAALGARIRKELLEDSDADVAKAVAAANAAEVRRLPVHEPAAD